MHKQLSQMRQISKPKLFIIALPLCLLSLSVGINYTAHADTKIDGQNATQTYCMRNIPRKLIEGCKGTSNPNVENARKAVSFECVNEPIANSKRADCIDEKSIQIIKAAIAAKPRTVESFGNKVTSIAARVAADNGGTLDRYAPGTNQSTTPTSTCAGGPCPPSSVDPAACALNPTIPGCTADANDICKEGDCDFVKKYINPAIKVLTLSFGLIVVISLISGGIQYSAAGGDPQKVSNAKKRVSMTILALVAYSFLYAFLQFLVPGGIF